MCGSKLNTDTQPGGRPGQYLRTHAPMLFSFLFLPPPPPAPPVKLPGNVLLPHVSKATTACTRAGKPSAAQHLPGTVPWRRWQSAQYHLLLNGITAWNGFASLSLEASCPRSDPAQHSLTSDRITAQGHACPQANNHTRGCNMTVPRINPTTKPTLGAALCHLAAPRINELSRATWWACKRDHSYAPHIHNETDQSNTLCRGACAHLPAYLWQAARRPAAQQRKGTECELGDWGYSKMEDSTLKMQCWSSLAAFAADL